MQNPSIKEDIKKEIARIDSEISATGELKRQYLAKLSDIVSGEIP